MQRTAMRELAFKLIYEIEVQKIFENTLNHIIAWVLYYINL